jgi:hypothetical protein
VDVLRSLRICLARGRCRASGDGGRFARVGRERGAVGASPDFLQEPGHPAKAAKLGLIAEPVDAFGENAAQGARRYREGAADQERPHERAVEAIRSGGNELHGFGESRDQVDGALLVSVELGHQGAEVDAGGQAEQRGHNFRQLPGSNRARTRVYGAQGIVVAFGGVQLLRQERDVGTNGDVVDLLLQPEGIQTGDLGQEIHDAVFATHQLAQAGGRAGQMFRPVGVGKHGRPAQHGRAEDIDPRCEGHVERRMDSRLRHLFQDSGEVEFVDQAGRGLKVLMPRNVR